MTAAPAVDHRVHLALEVADLAASLAFYRALWRVEPRKLRPGYAKFDLSDPPLNLTLNERAEPRRCTGQVSHLGVEVRSGAEVRAAAERLRRAGLATRLEVGVSCCYARQDKVWVSDPDGNAWEVFTVLGDADGAERLVEDALDPACCSAGPGTDAPGGSCCGPEPIP